MLIGGIGLVNWAHGIWFLRNFCFTDWKIFNLGLDLIILKAFQELPSMKYQTIIEAKNSNYINVVRLQTKTCIKLINRYNRSKNKND